MNLTVMVGRLCQDPEVKYTQSGIAVANFSIAVDSGYGDNKRTDFIPVVAWRKLAEVCGNNLSKGRRVLVTGHLQIRTYTAQDGTKRRVAEIVADSIEFLDYKKDQQENGGTVNGYDVNSFGTDVFPEENIPF